MLPFTVQIEDGIPISDQVYQAVRKAVLTGQLQSGDLFPSVRALSQSLRISPTTAHKVVGQLKDQGYLASRPGIGMVIRSPEQPSEMERLKHLEPMLDRLLTEATHLDLTPEAVAQALLKRGKNTR